MGVARETRSNPPRSVCEDCVKSAIRTFDVRPMAARFSSSGEWFRGPPAHTMHPTAAMGAATTERKRAMRIDGAERRTRSDDELEWMRVARGLRALALTGVVAGIGLVVVGTQPTPSVVAQVPCPHDAIDMAASAICGDRG